jgi:coenzyme PQQ precursor peptide PqqA
VITPSTGTEQQTQPGPGETAQWQTPEFAVVETAMEVTAYSLTAR